MKSHPRSSATSLKKGTISWVSAGTWAVTKRKPPTASAPTDCQKYFALAESPLEFFSATFL